MRRLPERRTEDWSRWSGKVSAFSTVNVKHNIYSVDSRLIGERIDVRVTYPGNGVVLLTGYKTRL